MAEYGSDEVTYGSLLIPYGAEAETPTIGDLPDYPWDLRGTSFDPAIPAPTGPYRFTPPADTNLGPISMWPQTIRAHPLGTRLMSHFRGYPRAKNVYKLADGTYTENQPVPTPVNHVTPAPSDRIVHLYRGGTVETVSAAEKSALEAAGYTVTTV